MVENKAEECKTTRDKSHNWDFGKFYSSVKLNLIPKIKYKMKWKIKLQKNKKPRVNGFFII